MGRAYSTHVAYKVLVRKSEGKRPHGGPRHRREDNSRLNLTEIGFKVDASGLN
jgi:hypothetical protein